MTRRLLVHGLWAVLAISCGSVSSQQSPDGAAGSGAGSGGADAGGSTGGGAGGAGGQSGSSGTAGSAGDAGAVGAGGIGGEGGSSGSTGTAGAGGSAGSAGAAATSGAGGISGAGGAGGQGGLSGSAGITGMSAAGGGSGTGGMAATGGRGGAGGTGGTSSQIGCSPPTVIDDLEDGNIVICPNQGRTGGWYMAKGASGTVTPTPNTVFSPYPLNGDPRAGSQYGLRVQGTGFSGSAADNWATLGATFVDSGVYDASAFRGMTFWAKSKAAALKLRVNVGTTEARAQQFGGTCSGNCNDYFGLLVDLTTTWQQYSIDFNSITQAGWGTVAPKNLAHLWNVEFTYSSMPYNSANPSQPFANPSSFDILVDDLQLY